MNPLRMNQWVIACAMACAAWMGTVLAEEAPPKHLQVARDIVSNVKPENNSYTNEHRMVRFPGDLFTSEYTVRTNCTGLVEASLDKGLNITPHFSTRRFKSMYSIIDWVEGVDRGEMFDKVQRVEDLKPGDMVMWKYIIPPAGGDPSFSGHIVMVDTTPRRVEPQHAPILEGAIQWELWIIDSSAGPMSSDDTRYTANVSAADANALKMTKKSGAGRGRIYLYTDADGNLLGQAPGFNKAKINRQDIERHIVMARVRYEQIKK